MPPRRDPPARPASRRCPPLGTEPSRFRPQSPHGARSRDPAAGPRSRAAETPGSATDLRPAALARGRPRSASAWLGSASTRLARTALESAVARGSLAAPEALVAQASLRLHRRRRLYRRRRLHRRRLHRWRRLHRRRLHGRQRFNGRRWRRNRNSRHRDRQRHRCPSHNLRLWCGQLIQHGAARRRVLALANVANDKADARERLGSASLIATPKIRHHNHHRLGKPDLHGRLRLYLRARAGRLRHDQIAWTVGRPTTDLSQMQAGRLEHSGCRHLIAPFERGDTHGLRRFGLRRFRLGRLRFRRFRLRRLGLRRFGLRRLGLWGWWNSYPDVDARPALDRHSRRRHLTQHRAGTPIGFLINAVAKAQLRSRELWFDCRLQILDQVRHSTIDDWWSGWRRRRHSDPDVYRRSAFDFCSSRRDLPDDGALAVRRLLTADRAEAQLRSLELRSDFPTQIFKQVWHPTQVAVTLGLLIDFRRHSDGDPNVNVGPASDFCSRSRRLLDESSRFDADPSRPSRRFRASGASLSGHAWRSQRR